MMVWILLEPVVGAVTNVCTYSKQKEGGIGCAVIHACIAFIDSDC
jgi:hypothetical protein